MPCKNLFVFRDLMLEWKSLSQVPFSQETQFLCLGALPTSSVVLEVISFYCSRRTGNARASLTLPSQEPPVKYLCEY